MSATANRDPAHHVDRPTYDHRIVDGREAVGFAVRVKDYFEDPTRLLFGL